MAWLAMFASMAFSLRGAWTPGLLELSLMFCTLAVLSEMSKIPLARVVWQTRSSLSWRWACGFIYVICVAVSISMMHLNAIRDVYTTIATETSAEQQAASLDAKVAELDRQIEEARTQVVPGIKPAEELKRALAASGRDAPSTRERRILEQDLGKAEKNAQLNAKIARLSAERSKTLTERAQTLPERSSVQAFKHLNRTAEHLNAAALLLPFMLEILICLGAKWDVLYNHELEATPLQPGRRNDVPKDAERSAERLNAVRKDIERRDNERFATWLRSAWEAERSDDGWYEGTQRSWAEAAGVSSSGYVNTQLKQLKAEGRIDYVASSRSTRVRFLAQKPVLKVVNK